MYNFLYIIMILSFTGLAIQTPSLKGKIIGILLAIVNGLIFWR